MPKTIVAKEPPNVTGTYLTTAESASYLKLSRQFLEGARYRADGSGPPFIKLARAVRYRKTALDAWMAAHDHSPAIAQQ
jgi:Helix-turn-helix domain